MKKMEDKKILVTKPVYEVGRNVVVKGRQFPPMTYLNNELVPGCNVYVEFSWIWEVPQPNPLIFEHSHDYDQIMLHIGSDPNQPEDLGAEFEIGIEGESIAIDRTHSLYLPKGLKHGPIKWKRVDRPIIEMTIVLGAGTVEVAKLGGLK